jgi:hypothetical protein
MIRADEFENILNECLDRIIKGESIESCLKLYPECADELERLLKTAFEVHQAALVKPSAEFRQHAANDFQDAIRNMPVKKPGVGFKWQIGWVAPVAIAVVLLAGGGGTVVAATNALPDSPLYGVKMATESVQLAFTFSDDAKTELYARFIDYRVEEIVEMAKAGNSDLIAQVTERMNVQLTALSGEEYNVAVDNEKAAFGLMAQSEGAAETTVTVPQTTTATTTQEPASSNNPNVPVIPPRAISGGTESAENPTTTTSLVTEPANVADLRTLLTTSYERNLNILLDEYEKATEDLKPFIQRAIDVLTEGYEQALANLG